MRLVNVTILGGKRAAALDAAADRLGVDRAQHVAWLGLVNGAKSLSDVVRHGNITRLDAPGRCAETELALLRRGGYDGPPPEHGQLVDASAWYAGYADTLRDIAAQLDAAPPHEAVASPADCIVMCDKLATAERLQVAGVPTPPTRVAGSVDDVWKCPWPAMFVKLRFGSSGSGIVALRRSGRGSVHAVTSVELDGPNLFNTRRLRRLIDTQSLDQLLRRLLPMGCVVQPWIRKAGVAGGTFDLRVFVLAGRASHVVPRVSRSPITNLHLLNQRGDLNEVINAVGDAAWRDAIKTAESAAGCFRESLHCGVDLAIDTRGRPWVIEVNAFGDLLPNLLDANGDDTHTAQLRHLLGKRAAA